MGRPAAGSRGRCRQRRRLRGRRQRRRIPGRRKAPAYGRRRTSPRRKVSRPKNAAEGGACSQAQPTTWKSDCCVQYQDPVRAEPPHPLVAPPTHWGTLAGSPTLPGSRCLRLNAPGSYGACTFEKPSPFSCPRVLSFSAGIPLGSPPTVGTTGWTSGPVSPRLKVHQPISRPLALQCASRDDWRCAQSMHEFSAKDIDGHMVNLDKYRGFVCIVTNVASQ